MNSPDPENLPDAERGFRNVARLGWAIMLCGIVGLGAIVCYAVLFVPQLLDGIALMAMGVAACLFVVYLGYFLTNGQEHVGNMLKDQDRKRQERTQHEKDRHDA